VRLALAMLVRGGLVVAAIAAFALANDDVDPSLLGENG